MTIGFYRNGRKAAVAGRRAWGFLVLLTRRAGLLRFANVMVANPVKCSVPLIEANIIDSPKGSVIILTNWHGKLTKNLVVTLPKDLEKKKLSRASGKPFKRNGAQVVLDLDVAEALILR